MAFSLSKWCERSLAPHDFADAGQEDEHVAACRRQGFRYSLCHTVFNVALLSVPRESDLHSKWSTFGVHHWAVAEQLCHWFGRKSRAHHDDAQFRSQRLPDSQQHPQHEIHLDCTLVEF